MKKPLVSFCVMCHNQEEYIAEALHAALDQTYSPLEVVVSDDCSTDRSWEIIQRIAADYRGPHKLVIHRNETNKKILGNFQQCCSMASGELLFKVDGDDISYPNRAEVVVKDWCDNGCKALSMCSSYDCINRCGDIVGEHLETGGWDDRSVEDHFYRGYVGCSVAIHRSLFDDYPSPEFSEAYDDALYHLRALYARNADEIVVAGKYRRIPEKLIKYRIAVGCSNKGSYPKIVSCPI